MKKKVYGLVAVIMAIVSVLGLSACTKKTDDTPKKNDVNTSTERPGGDVTESPVGSGDIDDIVEYYGCPNSKRIKKLNTKKRYLNML